MSTYCCFLQSASGPVAGQRDAAPVPVFAFAGPVSGRPYSLCPGAYNRPAFRCLTLQKFPGNRGILFCIAAFSMALGRPGTGSIPPAAFAATSLCTREAFFARLHRVSLFHGAWPPRHRINPTGGIRRHLPLHKGGFFAPLHRVSLFYGAWPHHATGLGTAARCGSTARPPRHRVNPTGGIRRHLPLHKGGFLCPIASGQPFLYHLAPTGPCREARKGSGKSGGRTAKRCFRTRSRNRLSFNYPARQRSMGAAARRYISRSSFSFLALSASTSLMNLSVMFWMSFSAIL